LSKGGVAKFFLCVRLILGFFPVQEPDGYSSFLEHKKEKKRKKKHKKEKKEKRKKRKKKKKKKEKKTKKRRWSMEKVILILEKMGCFGYERCKIIVQDERIYCEPETSNDVCDGSQLGWGGMAFCPLHGFEINMRDKGKILKCAKYCEEIGLIQLYKLLKSLAD
jgi:hypothetical protein